MDNQQWMIHQMTAAQARRDDKKPDMELVSIGHEEVVMDFKPGDRVFIRANDEIGPFAVLELRPNGVTTTGVSIKVPCLLVGGLIDKIPGWAVAACVDASKTVVYATECISSEKYEQEKKATKALLVAKAQVKKEEETKCEQALIAAAAKAEEERIQKRRLFWETYGEDVIRFSIGLGLTLIGSTGILWLTLN